MLPSTLADPRLRRPQGSALAEVLRIAVSDPRLVGRAPGYFHAVDLLRGLAALAILFWHYSHFYTLGDSATVPHATSDDPLYAVFRLMYDHGGNAVQLFWLISGFTFSAVYTRRPVTTRVFAVHRFARLYPLHLLTLLCVAALQLASERTVGHTQIYGNNDWPHFLDQLCLTSGWGPTIRFSFNGPIWSVSVELLMYALFWLLLPRLFVAGAVAPVLLASVSLALSRFGPFAHILQGGFFFFTGCGLFPVFLACRDRVWTKLLAAGVPIACALVLLGRWHAVGPGSTLLFVGLVLAATFVDVERRSRRAARAMKWLGDNTYGTYLWHVPVQIALLTIVDRAGLGRGLFSSPLFLLCYLAGVVIIARASFVWFERPSRTYLNRAGSGVPAAG